MFKCLPVRLQHFVLCPGTKRVQRGGRCWRSDAGWPRSAAPSDRKGCAQAAGRRGRECRRTTRAGARARAATATRSYSTSWGWCWGWTRAGSRCARACSRPARPPPRTSAATCRWAGPRTTGAARPHDFYTFEAWIALEITHVYSNL